MKKLFLLSVVVLISTVVLGQSECSFRKKEVDEFTGVSKVITNEELFISHTDSLLMKYYKGKKKQYFEVECYTAKIDHLYVVYFYVVIQTKSGYDRYGSLRDGAKIMIKMIDGSMVDLIISKTDTGNSDYEKGTTTYSTYCRLDEDQLAALKSSGVEKVRIYWSKGYDNYNCINPDQLQRQLTCLDQ